MLTLPLERLDGLIKEIQHEAKNEKPIPFVGVVLLSLSTIDTNIIKETLLVELCNQGIAKEYKTYIDTEDNSINTESEDNFIELLNHVLMTLNIRYLNRMVDLDVIKLGVNENGEIAYFPNVKTKSKKKK